ncbi:AFR088Wp [Eremothecium gossypii ATCC 10895]|uniref:AFR088Wp n=1 Tax=Eremothecium gossypii (strain ATCC 10895 / CBS 109.51 / FGSC 9923 / NRRL Y-1056) TaxID=284811 RepID=Q754I6_EREGS|nr:AFR088Wp [Eremothecium gossypii ATCC 10895]AAS53459.1 AFR088Wp [Eremothecium gossypii ATCC 10895]
MSIWQWRSTSAHSASMGSQVSLHDSSVDRSHSGTPEAGRRYNTLEHPRIIERHFGEAVRARWKLLRKLSGSGQLDVGPPDLVHVTGYDRYHQVQIGEHHYITGLDVSSEAMPIAYMNTLRLGRKHTEDEDDLVCTFCTVNLFSKVDVRIRFESERAFQVYAVDCGSDEQVQMSDGLWEETFVSGCIRSMVINSDRRRKVPGLIEYPIGAENGRSYSENVVFLLCKYLPRAKDTGVDLTVHTSVTSLQNYLADALLKFLSINPGLFTYAIECLQQLIEGDPANDFIYRLMQAKVAICSNSNELKAVQFLNSTVTRFLPNIAALHNRDLQNAIDLLNVQVGFLLQKEDYEFALPLAQKATSLVHDNFLSWEQLATCYIGLGQYDEALLAINCMPRLAQGTPGYAASMIDLIDSNYYKRPMSLGPTSDLYSVETNYISHSVPHSNHLALQTMIYGRTVMSRPSTAAGCIEEIWNGPCMKLGPIYGPDSFNLLAFVSPSENNAIKDRGVLQRNSSSTRLSGGDERVYSLLMDIVARIGWNRFLDIRARIFVMRSEHSTSPTVVPELKQKRLCEKWLDELFLNLYEDLRVSANSPLHTQDLQNSGLEWQLLGLTLLRTRYMDEAVACLRTSILVRFDVISAHKLLHLFLDGSLTTLDTDVILRLVVANAAYAARFYDWCQTLTILVLRRFCEVHPKDVIRSRIHGLYPPDTGILPLIDRFLDRLDFI